MIEEKTTQPDDSGTTESPNARSRFGFHDTSLRPRTKPSGATRLDVKERDQGLVDRGTSSAASQFRRPLGESDASDSARPVSDPLLRAFPDHKFLEESRTNPQLGRLLRTVILLSENTLGQAHVPFSIRLARIDDPDEPGWIRRTVRVRVPRIPRERRDRLWNELIDGYENSLRNQLASISPAARRKAMRRLAESVFIELEMR
jgi:hypothetical protein